MDAYRVLLRLLLQPLTSARDEPFRTFLGLGHFYLPTVPSSVRLSPPPPPLAVLSRCSRSVVVFLFRCLWCRRTVGTVCLLV